jgi:FixJ family two-component response regulator
MPVAKKIVAIIDENVDLLFAIKGMLVAKNYRVELYSSGLDFADNVVCSKAGCLIVDLQLGDISGMELVERLSQTGLALPVIFMTGSDDEKLHEQAVSAGCLALLQKPFQPDRLLEAVKEAIG